MRRLREKMLVIAVILIIMTLTVGMLMPLAEAADPKSNIRSLYDGLWWAVTTVTSVGYGDHFPITYTGRMLGFFLIIFGSSFFFVLTSLFAAMLLLRETEKDQLQLMKKLHDLEDKIQKLS
jgi:voltage-gated potassium channel